MQRFVINNVPKYGKKDICIKILILYEYQQHIMKIYPKSQNGKDKIAKLIDASIKIIADKGFSGTSIGDITREAGVSYGLFYVYFKNKNDLLDELIKKFNHELRIYLKTQTEHINNRIDMEKKGFEAFFTWVNHNSLFFKILMEAQVHRPKIYEWHYNTLAMKYSMGLEKAMQEKQIVTIDPEILSYSFMGMCDFIARKYILWDNREIDKYQMSQINKILELILNPTL